MDSVFRVDSRSASADFQASLEPIRTVDHARVVQGDASKGQGETYVGRDGDVVPNECESLGKLRSRLHSTKNRFLRRSMLSGSLVVDPGFRRHIYSDDVVGHFSTYSRHPASLSLGSMESDSKITSARETSPISHINCS